MSARTPPAGFRAIPASQLHHQLFQEQEHDTYKLRYKPAEPSVCPDCGAVFHAGRWQWGQAPAGAAAVLCSACHRVRDRLPAGFVQIGGPFFQSHRDDLTALVRHHEERTKAEHPLKRIIAVEEAGDGVLVTTTDIHLARDIGEALHHAYQGELEFHYNDAEKLLRVHWQR